MCEFASFVLTRNQAFWLSNSDSHEKIIDHYNLQHFDKDPIGVVRVDITPPKTSAGNLDSWEFSIGQDVYPSWTFKGDPSLEIRTREALQKRAAEEKWFEHVTGQNVMSGKFGTASTGDHGIASAGDGGKATAGEYGTATAGNFGTASAGDYGTATAGNFGTASAGYKGRASVGILGRAFTGDGGKASTGYGGTASAGNQGTASAGNCGTASTGANGTASAGDSGTASAGYNGTASAGKGGTIIVQWFDQASKRRTLVGYIGEGGLEPNTKYRVENGAWVKAG